MWHRKLYLIDHGAALYFHHNWETMPQKAESPFTEIGHHVLLPWASRIDAVRADAHRRLTREVFAEILEQVPNAWLESVPGGVTAAEKRTGYLDFFMKRLKAAEIFEQEAIKAHARLI
jgi:hypothetical protein